MESHEYCGYLGGGCGSFLPGVLYLLYNRALGFFGVDLGEGKILENLGGRFGEAEGAKKHFTGGLILFGQGAAC